MPNCGVSDLNAGGDAGPRIMLYSVKHDKPLIISACGVDAAA